MDKDIYGFSFDEIVNDHNDENDITVERLIEIKRYEKMYLLKPQSDYNVELSSISDDERLGLFDKIVFSGFRRNYVEDLSERDYSLEGCTPYKITIGSTVIEDGSWGDFLCKIAACLLDMYPEKRQNIEDFHCAWTKALMVTSYRKTNYKAIDRDLYLNCNHTAVHSCWLLQDLLDYFGIDKKAVCLLIHRPCSAERKELKTYIEKEFKRGFKSYICMGLHKEEDYAEKVIRNIDKFLNPMLKSISKSYTNFFLFDDVSIASNYIKKVREIFSENLNFDEKVKKVLSKYLRYMLDFYKL